MHCECIRITRAIWAAWTAVWRVVEQQRVQRRFAVISFIAALRPEGDAGLLPTLAAKLPTASAPREEVLGRDWEQVWPKGQKRVGVRVSYS